MIYVFSNPLNLDLELTSRSCRNPPQLLRMALSTVGPGQLSVEQFRPLYESLVEQGEVPLVNASTRGSFNSASPVNLGRLEFSL